MSVSMKYVLAFMGILRWDVIEPEFYSSHFTFDKKWTFIWSSYVTLCHKKTGPEMNKSTFTTCMMRVWQGGCASNYLHCGTVTHERLGGHKVISLSLRHHPISYLPVSFFWVVSFPKDTNSRSVLLGNKSVLAGVGNGATAPRPSRNIQHQLQP